jgi:hypothetical protein
MDNVNQPPPGHNPQDNPPTQPYRFTPGWPGDSAGHGPYPGPSAPGGQPPKQAKIMRKKVRWTAGIAAAALLAAGGTLIGLNLAGHSSPAAANTASATALNSELSAAATPPCHHASKSGTKTSGSTAAKGSCHVRRLRLLREIHGMYGQIAYNTSSGTKTLAFERGTIQSVSNGQLIVKAKNGTTWTWTVASGSVIKQNSKAASSSALFNGDRVFVAGWESGSAKDARVVLIHTGRSSSGSGTSSSGQSSSTSSAA